MWISLLSCSKPNHLNKAWPNYLPTSYYHHTSTYGFWGDVHFQLTSAIIQHRKSYFNLTLILPKTSFPFQKHLYFSLYVFVSKSDCCIHRQTKLSESADQLLNWTGVTQFGGMPIDFCLFVLSTFERKLAMAKN